MSGLMNRIDDTGTVKVALTMGACIVFGVLSVSVALWDHGTVARGLLWAGAWSAVGWFLGFLFGIPRFLSTDTARTPDGPEMEAAKRQLSEAQAAAKWAKEQEGKDPAATRADVDKAAGAVVEAQRRLATVSAKSGVSARGASLTVNTNLEQISDWLTKIIVGVSLVESQALLLRMHGVATFMARSMIGAGHRIPESAVLAASTAQAPASAASAVAAAAEAASAVVCREPCGAAAIAPSLQAFHAMESVAYAVKLYFLATGLLGSYLLTRLYLQRVLGQVANENGA